MSQTTVNLGYVLINRGEYVADPVTKYYKDNVVQYQGSAFIASPVDYDEETNPLAYVTVAPYDTDPNNPNEGWKVFASDAAYVNSFMFFTENPEWVYVVCDKEDKILFGVKQDGEFYFGAGCPSQVKEYVEQRISEVSPENYEQVLAFLQDYLGSDTTLKMIINALDAAKLDKEGLDADALAVQSITESPEYLQVTTDSEDKILEGIKSDGTKVIGADLNVGGNSVLNGDLQVLGSLDISGATYSLCQSPEWIKVLVDSQERIIAGVRTDGSVYINKIEGVTDAIQEIREALGFSVSDSNKTYRISVLGDSISTFNKKGYKIDGYAMYYPNDLDDVDNVNDTWWKQVINELGGKLEVNASYSGSTASSLLVGIVPRVSLLGNPDTIFVALGSNDYGSGVAIGTINYNDPNPDLSQFAPAYVEGIKQIKTLYPTAKVVCLSFTMSDAYADVIKQVANHYGYIYIDVRDDDGEELHPNKKWMSNTAGKILSIISSGITFTHKIIENPDFIQVTTDSEGKILQSRNPEGVNKEYVGIETPSLKVNDIDITDNVDAIDTMSVINDPEGRTEIKTDSEGKILSYRDSEGVMHENVGIETNHLGLSSDATQDLINALDALGYTANNPADWSDSEFVEIPIPSVCAVVNIEVDSQAEAKGLDIPTYIQFWDKAGNYFRKPIELNAQGASSMSYHIKNQAIDFTDGSKLKFGNWVPCDSFHIKKYFIDVFRGQCIVGYWLTEQMYQTRPYGERRPWDYLNSFDDVDNANGSFSKDYDTGALAHPDGFPVKVFFNGKNAGIYAFNLKKDRSNYYCKKDKQKQIILDGILGSTFWRANGDLTQPGEEGGNIWHDFEVRNPKISKDINGNKYDGDNPTEPSDDYATTKAAIERLTTAITLVNAESTTEAKKAKFEEFFLVPFLIDYDLIGQVIHNYDGYRKNWIWLTLDGNLWCPTSYDMDSIFGMHWNGASYVSGSLTSILGTDNNLPTGTDLLKGLYQTETRARYKELRDKGIFSVDNIINLLEKWVNACGYNNLKEDIEEIVTSPYVENGNIVVDGEGEQVLIPNTPSYRDGTKEYVYTPTTGGWYNSILRVKNWLAQRIQNLDTYYAYTNN